MTDKQPLARVDRIYEQSEPITNSVNELCLGRPVNVVIQALGFAVEDALMREHPFSQETVTFFHDLVHSKVKRVAAERPTRVQLLALAHMLALEITYLSVLLDTVRVE